MAEVVVRVDISPELKDEFGGQAAGSPWYFPVEAICAAITLTPRLSGSLNLSGSQSSSLEEEKDRSWPVWVSRGSFSAAIFL